MGSGYDVDMGGRGVGNYLALTEKGQTIRIRIASEPFFFEETFHDKDTGEDTVNRKVAWIVLHKTIGDDGKAVIAPKTYKAGPSVFNQIKTLAKKNEWGDPTGYDIEVTRTEIKPTWYSVTPCPNGKPITEAQSKMIADADFDLVKLYVKAPKETPADEDDPFKDE